MHLLLLLYNEEKINSTHAQTLLNSSPHRVYRNISHVKELLKPIFQLSFYHNINLVELSRENDPKPMIFSQKLTLRKLIDNLNDEMLTDRVNEIKFQLNQYQFQNSSILISNCIIINQNQIKLESTIIKQSKIFSIHNSKIRILLGRYLNKLNSKLQIAKFLINCNTGSLSLRVQSNISKRNYKHITSQNQRFQQYIKYLIFQSKKMIQTYLLDILYLAGQINLKSVKTQNNSYFGRNQQKINELLKSIMRGIRLSNFQFQFMFLDKIDNDSKVIINQISESHVRYSKLVQKNHDQLTKLYSIYQSSIVSNSIDNFNSFQQNQLNHIQKNSKYYSKHLVLPVPTVSNTTKHICIFPQILIVNTSRFENISIDDQINLKKAQIDFIFCETKLPYGKQIYTDQNLDLNRSYKLKKILTFKQNIQNQNVIDREKLILSTYIGQKVCLYISKFYFNRQKQFHHFLIMDYYSESLKKFKINQYLSFSLMTKIYLLIQVIQGLRFLRENDIYHLKIQPSNVLIAKNLLVKLNNFSKSYHPKVQKVVYHPIEATIYSSPELFENQIKYSQKIDVFSVGVLMHELLFDFFPIQKLFDHQSIPSKNQIRSKIINLINVERSKQNGPVSLMEALMYLCIKCVNTNPTERPYLDWLVVILKESLNYLDKLY